MRRTVFAAGLLLACWSASCRGPVDRAALCQDLTNLQSTVSFLAAPPPTATVGEVRGSLDKVEATFGTVHGDEDVPDEEDDQLISAQEDYRDELKGIGDDDAFAPYVSVTAGPAQRLETSYGAVRARLVCPSSPAP
jgi:hypothetical protein